MPYFILAFLLLAACGDDLPNADPPELHDIDRASAPVREAAKAVVRIEHPVGIAGTGSFISADGLLLTNAHVLGGENCAREGCAVSLTFEHQRGTLAAPARQTYAVPQHVDVGLDMAVVQIFSDEAKTQRIATPDFLSIDPRSASDLIGQRVTAIGHPLGRLKKWSSGYVIHADGEWFDSTVFSLPGGSGSPMLSDDGKLVGLLHRGAEGFDLLTGTSTQVTAVGSASADLQRALALPLPATVISVAQSLRAEDVLPYSAAFLAASTWTANVDGRPSSLVSLMGKACDDGLARDDYESIEHLKSALSPCFAALGFIECRRDVLTQAASSPKPCPDDRAAWLLRLQAASSKQQAFNGTLDLSSISYATEGLADSQAAGEQTARTNLLATLDRVQPKLDFSIASYLVTYSVASYANQSLRDLFVNYAKVPFYQRSAWEIVSSALWLYSDAQLTRAQTLKLIEALYHDDDVSLGDKLRIEEVLYDAGQL